MLLSNDWGPPPSFLIEEQVGPESSFGKSVDPENKKGVNAILEARIQELVEAKLDEVLKEFALDENGSTMSAQTDSPIDIRNQANISPGLPDLVQVAAADSARHEQPVKSSALVAGCNQGDDTEN